MHCPYSGRFRLPLSVSLSHPPPNSTIFLVLVQRGSRPVTHLLLVHKHTWHVANLARPRITEPFLCACGTNQAQCRAEHLDDRFPPPSSSCTRQDVKKGVASCMSFGLSRGFSVADVGKVVVVGGVTVARSGYRSEMRVIYLVVFDNRGIGYLLTFGRGSISKKPMNRGLLRSRILCRRRRGSAAARLQDGSEEALPCCCPGTSRLFGTVVLERSIRLRRIRGAVHFGGGSWGIAEQEGEMIGRWRRGSSNDIGTSSVQVRKEGLPRCGFTLNPWRRSTTRRKRCISPRLFVVRSGEFEQGRFIVGGGRIGLLVCRLSAWLCRISRERGTARLKGFRRGILAKSSRGGTEITEKAGLGKESWILLLV